jgi:hypothetical protein
MSCQFISGQKYYFFYKYMHCTFVEMTGCHYKICCIVTSIGFVLIIKHIIPVYILGIRQCNRFCNDNQSFQQMCSACICKKNNIFDQKWTDNSFVHTVSRISKNDWLSLQNLLHCRIPKIYTGMMCLIIKTKPIEVFRSSSAKLYIDGP